MSTNENEVKAFIVKHEQSYFGVVQSEFRLLQYLSPEMDESNFLKVCTLQSNNRFNVSLYRSRLSGMRVAFAKQPGPIINGWFTFATKATSDDGLPHTLEHLIFHGSQNYPYSGFLDNIAHQCFVSNIDAYTEEDHTAYSFGTIGEEGFFKILPVYLDHLFFPLLTPEKYMTEIHHINEEGRDGGVVYAEMQGRENNMADVMNFAERRLTFPEGHPFRMNCGGTLSAIRDLCSLKRVKAFHKEFYHPSNSILTIVGNVDERKVLNILSAFEANIPQASVKSRPFDTVDMPDYFPIKLEHIQYPAEDETIGNVYITWQGPAFSSPDSYSLPYLFAYFCSSIDSPLQQRFTQIKDPICNNVSYGYHERPRLQFQFRFYGVKQKFFNDEELFKNIPLAVIKESKIDMERMKILIKKRIEHIELGLEGDFTNYYYNIFSMYPSYAPGVTFDTDNVLYLQFRLNEIDYLNSLLEYDICYWENLAEKYFTHNHLILIGHPSATLVNDISQKEKDRIKEQIARLGAEGLKKCADDLQNAIAKNASALPPSDALEGFIVDNIDLKVINVEKTFSYNNSMNPVICHKIDSKFLEVIVMFDLRKLSAKHRSFINLYTKLIFSSDVKIGEKTISNENLPTMLKNDFISYAIYLNSYTEFLCFGFIVLPEKCSNVAKWMPILLKDIIFDNKRIDLVANRLASGATQLKQNGATIASELATYMITSKFSNTKSYSMLTHGKFYQEIADYVSNNYDGNKIVDILNEISKTVISSPMNIHLIGNDTSLKMATAMKWNITDGLQPTATMLLKGDWKYSFDFLQYQGKSIVIPYNTNESGFLRQYSEAKFEYISPEIVYAKILCEYFNQADGPIYTNVRGKGLAYGAYIFVLEKCAISLSINRAADLTKAYEECKNVVLETINSKCLNENLLKAAKRSMISHLIRSVSFPPYAGSISVWEFLHETSSNDSSTIEYEIEHVWQATPEKIFGSVSQYFIDIFDNKKCIAAIVPHQNHLEQIEKHFKNAQTMTTDDFHSKNSFLAYT